VIRVVILSIPPSGNHYKGYNRSTGRWFVRKDAVAFKCDVAWALNGRQMPPAKAYRVRATIYLPKGKRGDADNFAKVLLDALQESSIFPARKGARRGTDAAVKRVEIEVLRDKDYPRTEITVSVLNQSTKKGKL